MNDEKKIKKIDAQIEAEIEFSLSTSRHDGYTLFQNTVPRKVTSSMINEHRCPDCMKVMNYVGHSTYFCRHCDILYWVYADKDKND